MGSDGSPGLRNERDNALWHYGSMIRRVGLSWPAFILAVAIGVAIFILAMVVIGVRLDTGPTLPDEPSSAEEARQAAASSYSLLADAAEGDETFAQVADMARSHEEAVGGVWVPWPDGAPDGATNPPDAHSDSTDVVELLGESIAATELALGEADSSDAPLYASMLLRQQVAYETVAVTAEGEELVNHMAAGPLTPDQVAELASEQTLVELDTARQWLETAAPHLESNDGARARIADLDDYTNAILDAGISDQRDAFATLPDWFLENPSAETALRLEAEASRRVARELFTYIPTRTGIDAEIVATALRFLSPSVKAELTDFPLLEVTT